MHTNNRPTFAAIPVFYTPAMVADSGSWSLIYLRTIP